MKVIYKTKVTTSGGRNGVAKSEDGVLNLELSMPKELGGPGGAKTNPEQLFAAGYSACFENALRFIGAGKGLEVSNASVTCEVGFALSGTAKLLTAALDVSLPDMPQDAALALTMEAHGLCPYSRAINGNIDVPITVNGETLT
tara:strand:- start:26883 stop:27311 length:429 start_codon:yes stop_codon:yes gene_type:complete